MDRGKKRKAVAETDQSSKIRRTTQYGVDAELQSHAIATTQAMLKSNYTDVTIKCQGREMKGVRAVLASRCKFFEACLATNGFRESTTRTITMNEDNPDALEAVIIYLHTYDVSHIKNWAEFSDETQPSTDVDHDGCEVISSDDSSDSDTSVTDSEDETTKEIQYTGSRPITAKGYLQHLARIFELADKLDLVLLAQTIATLFNEHNLSHAQTKYHDDVLEAFGIIYSVPAAVYDIDRTRSDALHFLHEMLMKRSPISSDPLRTDQLKLTGVVAEQEPDVLMRLLAMNHKLCAEQQARIRYLEATKLAAAQQVRTVKEKRSRNKA